MTDEIVKYQSTSIIRTMDDAERAARAMANSGFFQDAKQASQALVKIMAGQELGFGPFASMTGVHIIKDKPSLGANLMASAIKRSGKYNYRVIKHDDNECHLEFFELFCGKWEKAGESRFTIDDAKKAGVFTSNANWQRYPRNQLFARALSNGQKWYCPDAFNGATVYTPDEMGATVDEDGNAIITVQSENIQPTTVAPPAPKAEQPAPKMVQRGPGAPQAVTLQSAKDAFSAAWKKAQAAGLGMEENKNAWRITGTSTVNEIIAKTALINAALSSGEGVAPQ